jgi:hypothetical protein
MRTTRSGESALLLLDVVDFLRSRNIEYAVIGAIAASIHGVVRASMDADAVLSLTVQKAADLERDFKEEGLRTEFTRGDMDDPIPAMLRLSDPYENRVDLLIGLRGLEREAFVRALDIPFQGETLKFIGREDFIAMKAFAAGPMDLLDARRALIAGGESVDRELLLRLAERYGREASRTLDDLLAG